MYELSSVHIVCFCVKIETGSALRTFADARCSGAYLYS